MSDTVDHRRRVLLFLKVFSTRQGMDRLVSGRDPDVVADRLCSLWIDELYVPGIRYRDGLKGDRYASRVAAFEAQFSAKELDLLAQFHRFLELRLEMLPKRLPDERRFPQGAFWESIMRHAARIIEEVDPEGLELDEIVERTSVMLGLGESRT